MYEPGPVPPYTAVFVVYLQHYQCSPTGMLYCCTSVYSASSQIIQELLLNDGRKEKHIQQAGIDLYLLLLLALESAVAVLEHDSETAPVHQ